MIEALRRQVFFTLNETLGAHVRTAYAEWLRLEQGSAKTLNALRDQRLEAVLRHATRYVPFYRERLGGTASKQLEEFPILTKTCCREHFDALMDDPMRASYARGPGRRYTWALVKTGGSSGVPTQVVHDPSFRDRGRASRMYSQYLCGFPFGVPYLRLWGSMAEINQARASRSQRLVAWLAGETWLNAFRMDPARMDTYATTIQRSSRHHLMAYVDAAHALASHIRRRGSEMRPLESIMACAGTLTEDARNAIASVFGARIHNKYGSRDCTDMACECDRGGLHIYSHHVHLEVVDEQGRPLPTGTTGRLLVTLLGNPSFPMIRYDIGDMGALSSRTCPCGRPFPLLDRLEGRRLEFLISTEGGFVSPVYVRHLIGVVHNPGTIQCFQLIQETADTFQLKLVVDPSVDNAGYRTMTARMERDLRCVLGSKARLENRRVIGIEPCASGKFLYTINRHEGRA